MNFIKKHILILFLFLALPSISFRGGIKFNLRSGYGTYSMTSLKEMNIYRMNFVPLPAKQMENFPMYWFYQGSALLKVSNNFSFGPMYAYHSTGSRYSLADYSGEYSFDDLIFAHSLGLSLNYSRHTTFNLIWGAYADGGINFSKLKMVEKLTLTEIEDGYNEETKMKSKGYFIEPGLSLDYPVKFLEPGIRIGYCIPIAEGDLKNEKTGQSFYISPGKPAKSGWNGFRVSFSLTININSGKIKNPEN